MLKTLFYNTLYKLSLFSIQSKYILGLSTFKIICGNCDKKILNMTFTVILIHSK